MKLVIEIELGNDAFEERGTDEVERLLMSVAGRIPSDLSDTNGELSLHDANGNWVGYARIKPGTIRTKR